jgi:hypothetical protein
MNMKEKELLMLMPEQKMYMSMPVPEISPGEEADQKKPEPTGETRTILGHTARRYVLEEDQSEYEIWATDELGTFAGLHLPDDEGPGAAQREGALGDEDFFPLLIIERRAGEEQTRVEVTEVERKTLPDSLFEPPADYRGMEMPFQVPQ